MAKTGWNELTAKQYIGDFRSTYFGYSLIEPIRANAASGGMISTIIIDGLRSKRFDGALLCRSYVENNEVKTQYYIATKEEEIAQSQGSKYIAVRFGVDAVPLIKAFPGKVAVVCLPCEATILNNLRSKDETFDKKLALVISLYCGHNSEKALTDMVLRKLNPKKKAINDYRYRFGHWRGNLKLTFEDGEEVVKPFHYFSDYQNLFFFSETKCLQCIDQTGFHADLSIGDIWSMDMKSNPIKHNAIIVRTEAGQAAVNSVKENGLANVFEVPVGRVCAGQARSLPLHHNVNARAWAGKRYGLRLKPISDAKLTLLEKLTASIVLFNYWLSRQKTGQKIIEAIPHFLIKLYLYFFKGLQVMQKPHRIYHTIGIIGATVSGNRGAESMLVTTIGYLKEKYPDANFKVFSYHPKQDRELVKDPRIQIMSANPQSLVVRYFPFALLYGLFSKIGIHIWTPSAVKRLRECSVMYDIGGITFAERGMYILFNIFTIWPAMLLGIPVIKLSQAMGPFNSLSNRLGARIFLNRCQKIYARGEITAKHLADFKLKKPEIHMAADIAFSYRPEFSLTDENPEKVEALVKKITQLKQEKKTVIVFSPSTVVLKRLGSPAYEQLMLDAIKKIDRPDIHYVFLPNSNREGIEKTSNNDIIICKMMHTLAESQLDPELNSRIDWIEWGLNTKSIREIIRNTDLVVTSRFHCMVSALAECVPVYVIGWSHKYQEVLQMFELKENAIDFSRANAETLAAEIKRHLSEQELTRQKIALHLPEVMRSSASQFEPMDVHFKD